MNAELALSARRVQPVRMVLAYGALGLPLAFAALPIYVHAPRLYAGDLGLSLATVGGVLLVARALDAITDPLIGAISCWRCRSLRSGCLPCWHRHRMPVRGGWPLRSLR
jgi:Na+/melibiose symporter-like transporter